MNAIQQNIQAATPSCSRSMSATYNIPCVVAYSEFTTEPNIAEGDYSQLIYCVQTTEFSEQLNTYNIYDEPAVVYQCYNSTVVVIKQGRIITVDTNHDVGEDFFFDCSDLVAVPNEYTVQSSNGHYQIITQASGKPYGRIVHANSEGWNTVEALYALCEALNGEPDSADTDWMDELVEGDF